MGKSAITDKYSNVAFATVTLSAANTLTFNQILMGTGVFAGVALLINRILWNPTVTSLREIVAATDDLTMALVSSNRLATIFDATDPSVLAQKRLVGIGVAVERYELPLISDFSTLPGGGKLIPASPLWMAGHTSGAAAASVIRCQLDFTFIQLEAADYLELMQSTYPANVS
jgi:hypothetical protein